MLNVKFIINGNTDDSTSESYREHDFLPRKGDYVSIDSNVHLVEDVVWDIRTGNVDVHLSESTDRASAAAVFSTEKIGLEDICICAN